MASHPISNDRRSGALGARSVHAPAQTFPSFEHTSRPTHSRRLLTAVASYEERITPTVAAVTEPFAATKGLSLKEISRRAVLEAEREVIRRALEQCRWNRVKTAKMLKISYRALLYKIKDMGLKQDAAAS